MSAIQIILIVLAVLFCLDLSFWILVIISSWFINTKKEYHKNSRYHRFLLNEATRRVIKVGRIKVHLTGKEKIPADSRFLLVCNHRSKFDPITTWYALKKSDIAFISKPENFKIFSFGRIIRRCCFLPIDRGNPHKAMKTIIDAIHLLEKNEVSIGIYPEGTRTTTGYMAELKSGSFKIAEKAKVPVVIMTAKNTEKICRNFPFRKTDVWLDILDVIPKEKVMQLSTIEMSEYAEKLMKKNMGEIQ
ncbi:MAG: 1-acyl-sn-glycerol-3-phosphate acyltransferase [Treponema sp.]|jgi:1-acyl-sn-glycerol-3-phosphate acyltransferase|nr:1-acyl-sn-glycerol-3-phosphate acyltransferase [Treponema sp.]